MSKYSGQVIFLVIQGSFDRRDLSARRDAERGGPLTWVGGWPVTGNPVVPVPGE